jgi:hypothetical protein
MMTGGLMKRHKAVTALRILIVCALCAGGALTCLGEDKKKAVSRDDKALVEFDALVQGIEDALKEAAKNAVDGFPKLKTVNMTVQTTISKDANGQIKLFVFTGGGTIASDNASTLTFELKPPPETKNPRVSSVKPEDIKDALVRAIQAARIAFVQTATKLNTDDNSAKLKTDQVGIEIGFTVSKKGTIGLDTGSLLPINIKAGGDLTKKVANTIKLTYSD